MADPNYEEIKPFLQNISSKIDWIGDSNLRRYLDAQVVMIHRLFMGKEIESVQKEAAGYLSKLNE